MIGVFRVQGDSMRPGLSEGDFVIALRRRRPPRVGERVVIAHPYFGTLVKRVVDVDAYGRVQCAGDNPASVDAPTLGWLERTQLLGIVAFAVKAPTTKGQTQHPNDTHRADSS